ncbi:4Fe-4S ferredoxin [candidate division KSB1 bacterium 4484_87]|nr:MAG: 4Fe-4S ferredoxin [candidate division KSB1 bacterium 4484_87]
MAKDLSKQLWHGIPRTEIPWYPKINEEKCIGCELCFVSCGREVFDFNDEKRKAVTARPFNCMVGCSTCATICPSVAIDFPSRDLIQKIEKEHKVLKIVRQKAKQKKTQQAYEAARQKAEQMLLKVITSVELEMTGHFGERQIMKKLYETLKDDPCDLVYISVETPSLKGCWNEKAPSYAKFRLVSLEYEDITPYLEKVKKILSDNGIVLISEKKSA